MADYVLPDGLRTWYGEYGAGDALVLLHPGGAGVDSRAWAPNVGALAERFHVYTPERRGHGHTPDVEGPITFDAMATDTVAFLEAAVGRPAHLVGCSDGAVVALLVAQRRPDLVRRLVLVAGVFHLNGWVPSAIDPTTDPPQFLAKMYEEVSPDGPEHYPVVVAKLARLHLTEPTLTANDLGDVRARTLVMIGDDDEVTLEHAIEAYRALPVAELMVAPGNTDSEGKGLSQGSHGRDRWLAGRSSGPDPPLQFGHPVNP